MLLFITSYFPPIAGGSASVYFNLCRELGSEAAVLTCRRHYLDGRPITSTGDPIQMNADFYVKRIQLLRPVVAAAEKKSVIISIFRLFKEDLPIRIRLLLSTLDLLYRKQIKVVVLGELYALGWLGRLLHYLMHIPYIHYIHGEELTTGGYSRLYNRVGLKSLRIADAVVAVSEFTYQEALKRGVCPERLHLITNGVDSSTFKPGPKSQKILDRHGLHKKKVLLTVGRVEERKGHDTVIAALPLITRKIQDIAYLIVGTGTNIERLRRLTSEVGMVDCVVFAGRIPDKELVEYYQTADLFIMPNRTLPNGDTEGFGLVFLEANACGKPVIGGNSGGVPDAIIHGVTGLLVNGESLSEVADAVIRILQDESMSRRMGSAGRLRAQEFSWKQKADQFRDLCAKVTNSRWKKRNASL
jgi:phosphatidylinositol alpha-1,6-mannosyltransferase